MDYCNGNVAASHARLDRAKRCLTVTTDTPPYRALYGLAGGRGVILLLWLGFAPVLFRETIHILIYFVKLIACIAFCPLVQKVFTQFPSHYTGLSRKYALCATTLPWILTPITRFCEGFQNFASDPASEKVSFWCILAVFHAFIGFWVVIGRFIHLFALALVAMVIVDIVRTRLSTGPSFLVSSLRFTS